MFPRSLALSLCCAAVLSAASARAQGPAGDAPSLVDAPAPFESKIEDPMLAPVPAPSRTLATWDEARQLLQQNSTDLRTAEAGVERAEGRWRQSLSALLPNARAQAGVAVDILHPGNPTYAGAGAGVASAASSLPGDQRPTAPLGAASVTVTQSVVDVPALKGLSSSESAQKSAEANLQDVRRRVTQGLARAVVAVVAAERAAEINRLGLRQALERAALTDRTFQLGAGTQLDVTRVRQDVTVARGALIAGDEQLRRTREALGLALGVDAEVGVKPKFELEPLIERLHDECPALENPLLRADVVAADENVKAASKSREQATAGYLPSIGLSTSAGALTTTPGPAQFGVWNIAAVLNIPIWEGGLRKGLVSERRGIEQQAEQAALAARRGVTVEATRAIRYEQSAQAQLATARESRDLAAKLDDLTRKSFQIGRASSLDLVQTAATLRQAELNLALREFEWVQARLDAFLTVSQCNP